MNAAMACAECGDELGHQARDPGLPHQLVMGVRWVLGGTHLYVSCNCLHQAGRVHEPLAMRQLWEPGEAAAVWRQHMAEVAA